MLPSKKAIHPFDVRYGTDTSGLIPGPRIAAGTPFPPEELTAYYGVAPSILQGVIDLWLRDCAPRQPLESTVFLDIGAGKGRALLLASQHPFLRVEGIELNADLVETAAANLTRWNAHPDSGALAPIILHHGDATTQPLPPDPTLAYLFHPFEEKLLRRFLRHIQRSLKANPRPFDLVYVNAEHGSLLDRSRGMKRLWTGRVPMSADDHIADLAAIADQNEYGSTGDEVCSVYRMIVN